ncbi:hypothetical protein U9M48_025950 [Paspalum notatum var. saurae]|uniref:DUF1618 domain-containing protein n=1 Tax=Paspalum notatum var. saurae TaxID=547442 RepID=A0AAQ3WYI2_PASNO
MQSQSSPPPPAHWWTEPSPPAPATGEPSWLILDRFVHRSTNETPGVVDGDATTSEIAHECVGRPIRASLRIADPPAVSRLYLHWSGRPEIDRCSEPVVIAAHRSSILFRLAVPFEDPMHWDRTFWFPHDYFVYSCSSSPPSLALLPPCFDGGLTDPKLDSLFRPHRWQQQRTMIDRQMGILCHGDKGEFTVADLEHHSKQEVELCLLHHPPPASSHVSVEWSVKRLQVPADMKINLNSWQTDVVVPIGGRCLCWVDYYQGMLLVDVLTVNNSRLHYIPLPSSKDLKSRRVYIDGDPDPFRCLSVSDAGIFKFVCILTKEHPSPHPFTIATWTLVDIHHGRWEKDGKITMGASEFFGLYAAQSYLPRVRPSFPVVSLVDPDIICFLLEDKGRNLFWIVQVNMRSKLLQSSARYINVEEEEEEEGFPAKSDIWKRFIGHYFIRSNFSSYLSEDAITSRKLSEVMQKVKEGRMMQKE